MEIVISDVVDVEIEINGKKLTKADLVKDAVVERDTKTNRVRIKVERRKINGWLRQRIL